MSAGQRLGSDLSGSGSNQWGKEEQSNDNESGAKGMTDVVRDSQDALKEAAQNTLGTAKQAAQDIASQTQEQVGDVVSETVNQASQAISDVKEQATSTYTVQRDRAIEVLNALAGALKTTGQQLAHEAESSAQDGKTAIAIAPFIEEAATRISSSADFLRDKEMSGLMEDARSLARKQPLLFLGAMLGVGLAAARMFKGMSAADSPEAADGSSQLGASTGPGSASTDSMTGAMSSSRYGTGMGSVGQAIETPPSENESARPDAFRGLDDSAVSDDVTASRSSEIGS